MARTKGKRGRPPYKNVPPCEDKEEPPKKDENQTPQGKQEKKKRGRVINDKPDTETSDYEKEPEVKVRKQKSSRQKKLKKQIESDEQNSNKEEDEKSRTISDQDQDLDQLEDENATTNSLDQSSTMKDELEGTSEQSSDNLKSTKSSKSIQQSSKKIKKRKKRKQKAKVSSLKTSQVRNESLHSSGSIQDQLQCEILLASSKDNDSLKVAQKRFPYLIKVFNERQKLKFKQQKWLAKQNSIKSLTKFQSFKNLKQILINLDDNSILDQQFNQAMGSYMSIDSGISVKLQGKYCDFTGFNALYKHKVNGVRYSQACHFSQLEKMQNSKIEEILTLRKVVQMIK